MIWDLITAAIQAILQVMVIVSFGFVLTKMGYFTMEKQKWLSRLNMVFFTPCLLFSNISSVISFEKLLAYWPIPVFYICFALVSFTLVHVICRLVRLNSEFRGFVTACVMFSNTNSLPIAVITSLAVSEAGKVLYWDADDTQEAVAARGISYTLFYAIFGNLLRWSYGYRLLQIPIREEEEEEIGYGTMTSDYGTSSGSDSMISSSRPHSPVLFSGRSSKYDGNHSRSTSVNETSGLLSSFPTLPSDAADDQQQQDDQSSMKTHVKRKMATWARSIHQFMTPPLYAAFLAIAVGLIPPLRQLMYDTFVHASVTLAIQSCGKAAVPIILVCLGAQLTDILEKEMQNHETNYSRKAVGTAIGIRMILAPLVVIPIVLAFVRYGSAYAGVAADPVFSVMMIIVGCTPTAINLVQISQVTGAFEDEMLHLLFWSYGVVCVPVFTLVVFAALNIVDTFL